MSNPRQANVILSTKINTVDEDAALTHSSAPAQTADSAQVPTIELAASSQSTNANPAAVTYLTPGADHSVTLPAGFDLENADFRIEGSDLVLVLADGSELVITGGAAHIPTFIIGDVELPQATVVAALESSNINVAEGPDGYSASVRAPDSSADFDDSAISATPEDFTMASLLEGTAFADNVAAERPSFAYDGRPSIIPMNDPIPLNEAVIADRDEGNQTYSGKLGFDPGSDLGTISAIGFAGASNVDEAGLGGDQTLALTSGGLPVTIETYPATSDTSVPYVALRAVDSEGNTVFTVTIDNRLTGAFTFELSGKLDHPDPGHHGEQIDLEDIISLGFTYTVTDRDGDSATGTFHVDIRDDGPTIVNLPSKSLDEEDLAGVIGNPGDSYPAGDLDGEPGVENGDGRTVSASLGIDWGADDNSGHTGALSFVGYEPDVVIDEESGEPVEQLDYQRVHVNSEVPLTSGDQAVFYFVTEINGQPALIGFTGTDPSAEENWVFTVTLDNSGSTGAYYFTLLQPIDHNGRDVEDDLRFDFDFRATDSDGDSTDGRFSVVVNDDAPVANPEATPSDGLEDAAQGTAGAESKIDEVVAGRIVGGEAGDLFSVGADGFGNVTISKGNFSVIWQPEEGMARTETVTWGEGKTGADGSTVFVATGTNSHQTAAILTINADGSYSFEMTAAYAHAEGNDSGSINIGFTATDKDGDTASGELWLHVEDDVPVAMETVLFPKMAEGSEVSGDLSRVVDFGADGVGGYIVETDNLSSTLTNLTSNGQALSYSVIDNTLYAKVDGTVIFTFAVDATTGAYGFKQYGALDHVLPGTKISGNDDGGPMLVGPEPVEGGPSGIPTDKLTLDLSTAVTVRDGDGDTLPMKNQLQITISDSHPSFAPTVPSLLSEDGPWSVTAGTGINFGVDGGPARELSLGAEVVATDQNNATVSLTSGSQIVNVALVGSILVGYLGNEAPQDLTDPNSVFSVSVDVSSGNYVFELYRPLDHGAHTDGSQYLDLTLQLYAKDADGDETSGTITVRIDASGEINGTSLSYAALDTGVFVNLGTTEASRDGHVIAAETAVDGGSGKTIGRDSVAGIVDVEGSKADDTLVGGDEANHLKGGAGDDLLVGGKGADTLDGGSGDDTLIVSADVDDLAGSAPIVFTAGDGSPIPIIISGASGENDALIGGSGNDTLRFEPRSQDQGFVFDRAGSAGELSGIETFIGTDGNDIILLPKGYTTSDAASIAIEGGSGNDILQGSNSQSDRIDGGADDDWISGLGGNDELHGGTGNDQIWGGSGDDTIFGGAGDDIIYGNAGNDTINAGSGDDRIVYSVGDGRDTISGGTETSGGRDLLTIEGSASSEAYVVWTRAAYNAAHGESYVGSSEILVTINGSIVAEVNEIEDFAIAGNGGTDSYSVIGDFTGTSLLTSTITLSGSDSAERFDVSGLSSSHSVVVHAGGGDDRLVIAEADGDIRWQDVKVLKDATTGEFSLSLPNGAVIKATGVESFQFSNGTVAASQLAEEAPSDLTSTALTVQENSDGGTAVGKVSGLDPNGEIDPLTYAFVKDGGASLVSPDGRFVIDADTGVISVAANAVIDYEKTPSIDLEIRVTDSQGLFLDKTFAVDVINLNEAPETADVTATGKEDGLVTVTFASTDTDGDQSSYVIKTLPGNGQLYLSAGSSDPLKVGDVVNSTTVYFKPTADYAGMDHFTYAAKDAGGLEDKTPATATITVSSEPDDFTFTLQPAVGLEDKPIALDFTSVTKDSDGSEHLLVTLNTIPVGTTIFDDKGHSFTSDSLADTVDISNWDLDSLQVLPPANVDRQFTFYVTWGYQDAFDGSSHPIKSYWLVSVSGVADTPTATVTPAFGSEDSRIPLSIEGHLSDTDGSETLAYTISGLPGGSFLSDGKGHGGFSGSVDVTGWDLSSLVITPPYNFSGTIDLKVTVTSVESGSGDRASISYDLPVTVEAVADKPSVALVSVMGTAEDGSARLSYDATLMDTDGSETLKLLISKIPAGTTIKDSDGHEFTATDGHTEVDVTAWNHKYLSVAPPANFNGDLKLDLVMVATETANGHAASTTLPITVPVYSVNDAPDVGGLEGGSAIEADKGGILIDSFTVSDVDAKTDLSFRVLKADGVNVDDRFEIVAAGETTAGETGSYELRLKSGIALDYEKTSSIQLTVEITDNDGSSKLVTAKPVTVTVIDKVDESVPTSVNENTTITGHMAYQAGHAGTNTIQISAAGLFKDLPSGTTYTYEKVFAQNSDAWLTFSSKGTISGTPGESSSGIYVYKVIATEPNGDTHFTYTPIMALHHNASAVNVEVASGYGNSYGFIDSFRNWEEHMIITLAETAPSMDLNAGKGNDIVIGNSSGNAIYGDADSDILLGMDGNDTIVGDSGRTPSAGSFDFIDGGNGDDRLSGGRGDALVLGGAGNDTISAGRGWDVMVGGSGRDTFAFKIGEGGATITMVDGKVAGIKNDTVMDFHYGEDRLATAPVMVRVADGNYNDTTASAAAASDPSFVIRSHAVVNGMVVFDDTTNFGSPLVINSNEKAAVAIQYLMNNDLGVGGATVAFTARFDGVSHTFVYQQTGNVSAAKSGDYSVFDLRDTDFNDIGDILRNSILDPIVLDLDRNGFAFSSVDHGVAFDINADGHKDQIAWTSGDGILAYDLNGNGTIDNGSEIFTPDFNGGKYASGIEALASLDTNGDGKIDGHDAAFTDLAIWLDANNNGISDAGELLSLTDHGVTEISLSTDQTGGTEDGQMVFSKGEFTFADGSTGSFLEVGFDTIFGSGGDGHAVFGTNGNDVLHGGMGAVTVTGGAGADTFVFDETALSNLDVADVITDYSLMDGDALDVSALLDALLGEQASQTEIAAHVGLRGDGTDTTLSVDLGDAGWKDVAVLQNHTEAVKILFDDKHLVVDSHTS